MSRRLDGPSSETPDAVGPNGAAAQPADGTEAGGPESHLGMADGHGAQNGGADSAVAVTVPAKGHPGRARNFWWDLGTALIFVGAAIALTAPLWRSSATMLAALGGSDNALLEWFIAHAAHAVTHLENPLFARSMNTPDGVNMMANATSLGLGIPMTPVTVAFGPLVSFRILLILALAGTAWSWYFVLSRHLVSSRPAAVLGGAFCGFAPGIISQALGSHLQMASQFLVPFIVWGVLRLGEPGHPVRRGLVLGLLITYQAFIGEEVLLFTALTCGMVVVTYAAMRPRAARAQARRFLGGLGVAAGVAVALLAYPLYFQFLGPQRYHGLPFDPENFYADLASYTAYARQSWAGSASTSAGLARNVTEENTFYGWPLVVLVVISVVWLWRRRLAARIAGVGIVVIFVLSLGTTVIINGRDTGIGGPWAWLKAIPPFDLTMSTRISLIMIPLVGVVLALLGDRLWGTAPGGPASGPRRAGRMTVRIAGTLAVLAAVVPIAPTAFPTTRAPSLPGFIANGTWQRYLPAGTTVMPAPVPYSGAMDGAHWLANTDLGFSTPGGYFIVPTLDGEGTLFSSPPRPLSTLLRKVNTTGTVPPISEEVRGEAIEDLRYWHTGLIVLATGRHREKALLRTLTALFGQPELVEGAWVWRTDHLLG